MLESYLRAMPKVELHVHLEGSIQPQLLLELARRNRVDLPVTTAEDVETWYRFTDFAHFIEIYLAISRCICTPDDIEQIARAFLQGQAEQNIRYSEVIFTPYTHFSLNRRIPFSDQLAALGRASAWASVELGIGVGWVLDISRNVRPIEHSLTVVDWAIGAMKQGVVGLGVGGPEVGHPPELFADAFARAKSAGLASLPHAGETAGPASIWGAVDSLGADRIGHGVRCLEDSSLVAMLRDRQIPLDVSPTSNVCLGVFASLEDHPLPRLIQEGLCVTLNSDDPPMFNTTLVDEYLAAMSSMGLTIDVLEQLVQNAVAASLLPKAESRAMSLAFREECVELRALHGL
jgi:aminodeoxyfutalosine deaminase